MRLGRKPPQSDPTQEPRSPQPAAHVLLVEDDVDTAEILVEFFQENGFEVLWAQTGREALDGARGADFGVAFVDMSLPDMEGLDVVAGLRALLPATRIAAVTGYRASTLAPELLRVVAEVFEKPADPERLLAFARTTVSRDVRAPP